MTAAAGTSAAALYVLVEGNAQLSDGEILELRWIDGADEGFTLNAPKGMAIRDDLLLVASELLGNAVDHGGVDSQHLGELAGRNLDSGHVVMMAHAKLFEPEIDQHIFGCLDLTQ